MFGKDIGGNLWRLIVWVWCFSALDTSLGSRSDVSSSVSLRQTVTNPRTFWSTTGGWFFFFLHFFFSDPHISYSCRLRVSSSTFFTPPPLSKIMLRVPAPGDLTSARNLFPSFPPHMRYLEDRGSTLCIRAITCRRDYSITATCYFPAGMKRPVQDRTHPGAFHDLGEL